MLHPHLWKCQASLKQFSKRNCRQVKVWWEAQAWVQTKGNLTQTKRIQINIHLPLVTRMWTRTRTQPLSNITKARHITIHSTLEWILKTSINYNLNTTIRQMKWLGPAKKCCYRIKAVSRRIGKLYSRRREVERMEVIRRFQSIIAVWQTWDICQWQIWVRKHTRTTGNNSLMYMIMFVKQLQAVKKQMGRLVKNATKKMYQEN